MGKKIEDLKIKTKQLSPNNLLFEPMQPYY